MTDPRDAAAQYRARQQDASLTGDDSRGDGSRDDGSRDDGGGTSPGIAAAADRAAFIETAIQVAMRRGEFDDLPGAGKPIEGLGGHHDPDWWIRRKIETENLTGLGPPALLLRGEDRGLDAELDRLGREDDVRAVVTDFNRRVIEARRQLQGGPPVVTATRDVDAEVAAWAERRRARSAASAQEAASAPEATRPRRRRFGRRRD